MPSIRFSATVRSRSSPSSTATPKGRWAPLDIARTIFEKIDQAEVFVADATLINRKAIDEYGMRATPNPNVLVELGYAAHTARMGPDHRGRVNTAHGAIEELPFDIRARRVVTYRFADEDKPAMARQELVGKLAGAIGPILGQGPTRRASGPDVSLQWREPPPDRRHPLDIHSESPFAPLDAGRLVLPAPLFADLDTFWGFSAAEERRFCRGTPGSRRVRVRWPGFPAFSRLPRRPGAIRGLVHLHALEAWRGPGPPRSDEYGDDSCAQHRRSDRTAALAAQYACRSAKP